MDIRFNRCIFVKDNNPDTVVIYLQVNSNERD